MGPGYGSRSVPQTPPKLDANRDKPSSWCDGWPRQSRKKHAHGPGLRHEGSQNRGEKVVNRGTDRCDIRATPQTTSLKAEPAPWCDKEPGPWATPAQSLIHSGNWWGHGPVLT
jgi:hypothetical protein